MLDIRATRYTSPAKEVEFASVPLTVRLLNAADEPAHVTGLFRVYDKTLGLLIFESEIEPVDLAAAATVDVSALTDWDPATPDDDRFFVQFDGQAVNNLVPDGIPVTIGAWHFDVKAVGMGPAPAAHAPTHELGGSDVIDCTGLSGCYPAPLTPFVLMTTAEMNAVLGPTEGQVIWNTDMHFPCAYDGSSWKMLPLMDQPEP